MKVFIHLAQAAFWVAAFLASTSCGGVISPSKNRVETFSAQINPGDVLTYDFDSKSGEFSVRLNELAPVSNIFMGVVWGQVSNGLCLRIQENPFARVGVTALAGQVLSNGRYCVQLFDVGYLTSASTFSLAVSHP